MILEALKQKPDHAIDLLHTENIYGVTDFSNSRVKQEHQNTFLQPKF